MSMPLAGRPAAEVDAALDALGADDRDFAAGRVFGLVFHAGHEVRRSPAAPTTATSGTTR